MFTTNQAQQFAAYRKAFDYYKSNPDRLIEIEKFVNNEILHFIDLNLPDIERDYNEASFLFPFWKNYPPLDRGRQPIGDQYPWIEVGENVFGNKLSRYFNANFQVKDSGLPSGSDERCIISSERIKSILTITDSVWVFIDIKSVGPRDDFDHAVMSPNQVSGSGDWIEEVDGVKNRPITAKGKRVSREFHCSLSPIYVLSDQTIAPLVTFAIKPVYKMEKDKTSNDTTGQPLEKIKIASIPNGILLTSNPNYLSNYPDLFFPGKDTQSKNPLKRRARVSFGLLKELDDWRITEVKV